MLDGFLRLFFYVKKLILNCLNLFFDISFMKEDFLHYVWKFQKFLNFSLRTSEGEQVEVLKPGMHNIENDGPDFFMAQVVIDDQHWVGNVEIHVKSSDWYVHEHQNDEAYDSVILHVVWENDAPIFRKNNTTIPTLELKEFISAEAKKKYEDLFGKQSNKWINCENEITSVNDFIWSNWLEKLFIERLENKSELVIQLLKENQNNWEATCFCMLAKAFGGNINGMAFFEMAKSIPFSIIQKETSVFRLEALFFGQLNMLNVESEGYEKELFTEYTYLQKKFLLRSISAQKVQFFRLRPSNFPTIRLSQLANLYVNNANLLTRLVSLITYKNYHSLLSCQTSAYWQVHYNFESKSKKSVKSVSGGFKDLLIINAVVLVVFVYVKRSFKDPNIVEQLMNLVSEILVEKNSIITKFKALGVKPKNALQSQAILNLYKNYCKNNKCLQCSVGNSLINS